MISLVYLLLSIIEGISFLGSEILTSQSTKEQFKSIYKAKSLRSQVEMCQGTGLEHFAAMIDQIDFCGTPNYTKLKELLIEGLDMDGLDTEE